MQKVFWNFVFFFGGVQNLRNMRDMVFLGGYDKGGAVLCMEFLVKFLGESFD